MAAVVFALAAALAWGTSDFLGGRFSTRLPVFTVGLISQTASLAALVLVATIFQPGLSFAPLAWGFAAGLFTSFGGLALYRGLSLGDSAVVAPLSACGAVVPVVFAFASGDPPSVAQSAGIAVAIAGILLVSWPREGTMFRSAHHLQPVLLGLIAAVGFGTFFVFVNQGAASDSDTFAVLIAARFGGSVFVGSAGALSGGLVRTSRPAAAQIAAVGMLDLAANGLFALASTRGNIAVASVLSSLYSVQTLLLAIVFTGERLTRVRAGGAALALAGVALVSA